MYGLEIKPPWNIMFMRLLYKWNYCTRANKGQSWIIAALGELPNQVHFNHMLSTLCMSMFTKLAKAYHSGVKKKCLFLIKALSFIGAGTVY